MVSLRCPYNRRCTTSRSFQRQAHLTRCNFFLQCIAYAANSETVVKTVYDLFNQNLFSLPKLLLLPSIVAKQPMLLMKITPLILFTDYIKSTIVSVITTEVERINKEVKDVSAQFKESEYCLHVCRLWNH